MGYIAQYLENANYHLCAPFGGVKPTTTSDVLADTVKAMWPKDTLVARLKASLLFCRDARDAAALSLPLPIIINDMTDERRYDEQESAFILDRASADTTPETTRGGESTDVAMRPSRGLTLQQLQEIAAEAGISREAVARAATAVGRGDLVPTQRRTYVGLPVGVARTIDIPRRVTDEEWDRIVVALRDTFRARGRIDRSGTLREWRNGNLSALLEPTARGHRLRLSTSKGDARLQLGFGAGSFLAGVATGLPLWFVGAAADAAWSPALMAVMGLGMIGRAAWMLPRWARTRESQMQSLADTVSRILEEGEGREPDDG